MNALLKPAKTGAAAGGPALRRADGVLPFRPCSAITPPFRRPADQGCRGDGRVLNTSTVEQPLSRAFFAARCRGLALGHHRRSKETSQMPKMKTKSGVKKRFRLTGSGKVIATQANKRHGMIKRTKKQIRNQRGTTIMHPSDAKIVKSWMPYG
jgi:large subunit ribosomal protein L35